jgi:hypothetical protein
VRRTSGRAPLIAAITLLGALLFYLPGTVNHDSAWSLYATSRWLDGARFYVDLVELNPPLNFYLHVPPVLLFRWTGLGMMPAFVLWISLMTLVSFALSVRITRQARIQEPCLWTALLAGALATSLFVPMGSFGQREHIVVLLSLSYFFASAVRASGGSVGAEAAIAAGLLAGVGLSLKPYFLVVPVLLELREVARNRNLVAALRPDSIALVGVVVLYGVSVPVLHPEYIRDVVPMALATYARGFGFPLESFLVHRYTLILVGVLGTYLIARPANRHPRVTDTFWLAALGFFAAYLWQMKGFSYHVGPVLALVFIALLPMAAAGPLVGDRGLLDPPQRLLSFLGLVGICALVCSGGRYPTSRGTDLHRLIQREVPGGTIAAFGSNMTLGFPLVIETNLTWGSRFPNIWPVPGVWNGLHGAGPSLSPDEQRELTAIMNWTRRAVAEDLQKFRPDLVIVDERPRKDLFDPLQFDWLIWAAEDSLFRELWTNYRHIDQLGPLAVYARGP